MNLLDIASKYKVLLSLVKLQTVNSTTLGGILDMFKVKLEPAVVEIIVSIIHAAKEEKKYTSLFQILTDPEISAELAGILGESVTANQPASLPQANQADAISVDSLIRCTHCNKAVHIKTALHKAQSNK